MKRYLFLGLACALLNFGGCKKEPPPPKPTAELSLEEQSRQIADRLAAEKVERDKQSSADSERAEKQRVVSALQAVSSRFRAEFAKLGGKRENAEIAPIADAMQAVRGELGFVSTSQCTRALVDEYGAAMDNAISLLRSGFAVADDDAAVARQQRFNEVNSQLVGLDGRLLACLN
jgi:hypothetical protein